MQGSEGRREAGKRHWLASTPHFARPSQCNLQSCRGPKALDKAQTRIPWDEAEVHHVECQKRPNNRRSAVSANCLAFQEDLPRQEHPQLRRVICRSGRPTTSSVHAATVYCADDLDKAPDVQLQMDDPDRRKSQSRPKTPTTTGPVRQSTNARQLKIPQTCVSARHVLLCSD